MLIGSGGLAGVTGTGDGGSSEWSVPVDQRHQLCRQCLLRTGLLPDDGGRLGSQPQHPAQLVLDDEVARWYEDGSTDPASSQAGEARQYAIIDIADSGTDVSSLAVALQLSGGSTWYTSDFGSGFPLTTTGHSRTVVKLPIGWQSQSITGAKVEVYSPSAAASVQVQSFTVESLAQDWTLSTLSTTAPDVVSGQVNVPTAIVASGASGGGQTVRSGALTAPFVASVTNSLGGAARRRAGHLHRLGLTRRQLRRLWLLDGDGDVGQQRYRLIRSRHRRAHRRHGPHRGLHHRCRPRPRLVRRQRELDARPCRVGPSGTPGTSGPRGPTAERPGGGGQRLSRRRR
jgi:hypothetical protein